MHKNKKHIPSLCVVQFQFVTQIQPASTLLVETVLGHCHTGFSPATHFPRYVSTSIKNTTGKRLVNCSPFHSPVFLFLLPHKTEAHELTGQSSPTWSLHEVKLAD